MLQLLWQELYENFTMQKLCRNTGLNFSEKMTFLHVQKTSENLSFTRPELTIMDLLAFTCNIPI